MNELNVVKSLESLLRSESDVALGIFVLKKEKSLDYGIFLTDMNEYYNPGHVTETCNKL